MDNERMKRLMNDPAAREFVNAYLQVPKERRPEALALMSSVLDHTIGELFINDNERLQLYDKELTCGDYVQVLDTNSNPTSWIDTRVEHTEGKGYYLVGIDKDPTSLFVRLPQ